MMAPALTATDSRSHSRRMSSSAPTKRDRPPNTAPSGKGFLDWLTPFVTTSVGMKATTAVTGAALTGFVVVHLVGNLKVFGGPDALNGYAKFLKDLGPFLWVARGGLLAVFVTHIVLALWLKRRALAARPIPYYNPATIQASIGSRTMPWTGAVILAFLLFHLAHYTFAVVTPVEARNVVSNELVTVSYLDLVDTKGRHDVYAMVVAGFHNPLVCGFYLLAQAFLFVHLRHGVGSVFQTLGLNTPRSQSFVGRLALGVAMAVALGNVAIVVAVWAGWVPDHHAPRTYVGGPG